MSNQIHDIELTLESDIEGMTTPKSKKLTRPVPVMFSDDGDRWSIATGAFEPVVEEDVEARGNTVTVVVSLANIARGTFDTAARSLTLEASFTFSFTKFNMEVATPSTLPLSLTSAQAEWVGRPLAGQSVDPSSGAFVMVGVGQFKDGELQGKHCAVVLKGRFSPATPEDV